MHDIKTMVKDKKVKFTRYRDGDMFYVTECGFEFPVPISDVGSAELFSEDKAILFMRYINKHIKMLSKV